MTEAEQRVSDFLDFWAVFYTDFLTDPETDHCDPAHPFETDPDILIAEYQNGVHKLLASDIRSILDELATARKGETR